MISTTHQTGAFASLNKRQQGTKTRRSSEVCIDAIAHIFPAKAGTANNPKIIAAARWEYTRYPQDRGGEPNLRCVTIRSPVKPGDAIGYAEHRSRSHDAVIRVYDDAGNVIATHEHRGDFKE
jgi:hypothetical protein